MSNRTETVRAAVDALADALEVHPEEAVRARLTRQIEAALLGDHGPRAKLTKAQRRMIREEYAHTGQSYRGLARKYGVNASTVLRVVKSES